MLRWIIACWVLVHLVQPALAQNADENLNKGLELLLAEEYHPAQYYLRLARTSSKIKSVQEEAAWSLAELFLLTQQPDSAQAIISQLKATPRLQVEVQFLNTLKKFRENKFDEALPELLFLQKKVPVQNSLLKGKVHYYAGVINFRKRTAESTSLSIQDLQLAIIYFKKDSLRAYLKLGLTRMQLADVYRYNKQIAPALFQLGMATKILEASPYPKPLYLASTYGIEGRILYGSNKFVAAKKMFEKSLQHQKMANADSASIGLTFSNLALCLAELYDFNACEKANAQTAAYWSTLKNQPDRLVFFSNNYALFLRDIQEHVTAIEGLQKVVPLLDADKLQSKYAIYQTYYNLALICYDLDDFASCKKYLDKLHEFVIEYPKAIGTEALININSIKAMWLRKEKKSDEAINMCQAIDSLLDSPDVNDLHRAKFYSTFGDILNSANRYPLSLLQLHKARIIYEAQQNTVEQIKIDNQLAMNFFGQNSFDSVFAYCNRSLQQNAIKDREGLVYPYLQPQDAILSCYLTIISHIRQFQQSRQYKPLDKAIPFEQLGIGLIRSIRKNLYSDADRVAYNKAVAKFYDACCLLYFYRWQIKNEGAAGKFFEYVEEGKFQALANGLSANRVNSFKEVNTTLLQEEKDLARQKILQNTQLVQLLSLSPDEDEIESRKSQARVQLLLLEKKHDRFLDSLRRNFSGYYVLKYGGQPVTLTELQTRLRPGQVVLELKVIDSLVVIQVISQNFVSLVLVPQGDVLHKQVSKLRNLIQFKLQSEFVTLSHEVFQSLIAPVETELKKNNIKENSIIVVPDDFFHLLPFEALVKQIRPLRYFIQLSEISYAYSCNLMVQNTRDLASGLSNNFLGIAPRFQNEDATTTGTRSSSNTVSTTTMRYGDYGFQPLKENENEINLIANLVNNQSLTRTLLHGEDADESHLKKLDLSKFRYIHFATHGFVNASNSGLSGLALTNVGNGGEDNILYTSEIYNLNLRADLVCLSACETGLGQRAPGEGLIGLGRAFFYSGARNLLVSLWKVPDESTSQFMIDFYQQFFNPAGHFSASLRQAKLKMLKTSAYQNPYYWAPFILIGSN